MLPHFGAGIADPGPLGPGAFAMTTFFLSSVNAGWLPNSVEGVVLGLALFYGGIVQVFAGMWEFAKGNTFGALAFSSYGAFWLSFWYLVAHTEFLTLGELMTSDGMTKWVATSVWSPPSSPGTARWPGSWMPPRNAPCCRCSRDRQLRWHRRGTSRCLGHRRIGRSGGCLRQVLRFSVLFAVARVAARSGWMAGCGRTAWPSTPLSHRYVIALRRALR